MQNRLATMSFCRSAEEAEARQQCTQVLWGRLFRTAPNQQGTYRGIAAPAALSQRVMACTETPTNSDASHEGRHCQQVPCRGETQRPDADTTVAAVASPVDPLLPPSVLPAITAADNAPPSDVADACEACPAEPTQANHDASRSASPHAVPPSEARHSEEWHRRSAEGREEEENGVEETSGMPLVYSAASASPSATVVMASTPKRVANEEEMEEESAPVTTPGAGPHTPLFDMAIDTTPAVAATVDDHDLGESICRFRRTESLALAEAEYEVPSPTSIQRRTFLSRKRERTPPAFSEQGDGLVFSPRVRIGRSRGQSASVSRSRASSFAPVTRGGCGVFIAGPDGLVRTPSPVPRSLWVAEGGEADVDMTDEVVKSVEKPLGDAVACLSGKLQEEESTWGDDVNSPTPPPLPHAAESESLPADASLTRRVATDTKDNTHDMGAATAHTPHTIHRTSTASLVEVPEKVVHVLRHNQHQEQHREETRNPAVDTRLPPPLTASDACAPFVPYLHATEEEEEKKEEALALPVLVAHVEEAPRLTAAEESAACVGPPHINGTSVSTEAGRHSLDFASFEWVEEVDAILLKQQRRVTSVSPTPTHPRTATSPVRDGHVATHDDITASFTLPHVSFRSASSCPPLRLGPGASPCAAPRSQPSPHTTVSPTATRTSSATRGLSESPSAAVQACDDHPHAHTDKQRGEVTAPIAACDASSLPSHGAEQAHCEPSSSPPVRAVPPSASFRLLGRAAEHGGALAHKTNRSDAHSSRLRVEEHVNTSQPPPPPPRLRRREKPSLLVLSASESRPHATNTTPAAAPPRLATSERARRAKRVRGGLRGGNADVRRAHARGETHSQGARPSVQFELPQTLSGKSGHMTERSVNALPAQSASARSAVLGKGGKVPAVSQTFASRTPSPVSLPKMKKRKLH